MARSTVQTNLVIGPTNAGRSAINVGDNKAQFKLKPCLACNDGSTNVESILHDTKKL